MKFLFLTFASLAGCISLKVDVVEENPVGTFLIRFPTGSSGSEYYTKYFEEESLKLCKGAQYEIIEKTFKPRGIKEFFHDDYFYYWKVTCR